MLWIMLYARVEWDEMRGAEGVEAAPARSFASKERVS